MSDLKRTNKPETKTLSVSQCLLYSTPHAAIAFLMASMHVVQGIYAKYYGVSLTVIAAILMFSRIFDAISDPLIGFYSDHYRRKSGSRKPFMFAGAMILALAGYFLYVPGSNVTSYYFAFWLIVLYFGWTLYEIPHIAWASDMSFEPKAKTRIFSYRVAAGYTGLFVFYVMPLLPFFSTNEITPETLKWSALVSIAILLPSVYFSLRWVPDSGEDQSVRKDDAQVNVRPIDRSSLVSIIVNNKPFQIFLAAYIFVGLAVGMWFGLLFIYLDSYIGRGDLFAMSFVGATAIAVMSTPIWNLTANYFGKKKLWFFSVILFLLSIVLTGFLQPEQTDFAEVLVLKTLNSLGFVAMLVVAPAILSDIVDYGAWRFKTQSAGVYFSLQTFLYKTTSAVGAALGLAIAGWYGFDATSLNHSESEIFGIQLAIAWIPSVLIVIAFYFIYLLPIDSRRHAIIRRRLSHQKFAVGA